MGKVMRPAFAGKRFDVCKARLAVHAQFKKTTLLTALELAEHADSKGVAELTIDLLREITGFKQCALLLSVQEIVASGLATRAHPRSPTLHWDLEKVAATAARYRPPVKPKKENAISHYLQGTWLDAFGRAMPQKGVPIRPPYENQWEAIDVFGQEQTELHKVGLPLVADISCEQFFKRRGNVAEIGKHAMTWLAGELDDDMARTIAGKLGARSAPPESGVGERVDLRKQPLDFERRAS